MVSSVVQSIMLPGLFSPDVRSVVGLIADKQTWLLKEHCLFAMVALVLATTPCHAPHMKPAETSTNLRHRRAIF